MRECFRKWPIQCTRQRNFAAQLCEQSSFQGGSHGLMVNYLTKGQWKALIRNEKCVETISSGGNFITPHPALIPFLLKLFEKPKSIAFWYRHQQAGHEWKENLSKHMLQCSQACVFILTGVHSSYQLPPAWAMCPLLVNTGTGPVSKPPNYNQQIMFSPLFTTHRSYDSVFLPSSLIMEMIQLFPCEQEQFCKQKEMFALWQCKKYSHTIQGCKFILRKVLYHLPPVSHSCVV